MRRPVRRFPLLAPGTVVRVRTDRPWVALTFDDGPDAESTAELLDILKRHGARATFFMLGIRAREAPEIVARTAAEGHAVGNHSWDHPCWTAIPGKVRREQIRRCAELLGRHGTRLFRPPFGRQTAGGRWDAALLGYRIVGWNIDSGDWWDPDAEHLERRLLRRIAPGAIVLLHDRLEIPEPGEPAGAGEPALLQTPLPQRRVMLEALDRFLARSAGKLSFVTVPDLLGSGRPVVDPWPLPPEVRDAAGGPEGEKS